jgi:hypothetical protein
MPAKAPPRRTRFRSGWDEINYIYHQILYWFYDRGDRERALRFGDRLEQLLGQYAREHESIFGEECWSLLSELRGDLPAAVRCREHVIELIFKLWEIADDEPAGVLDGYGVDDLADRFDILATLYHDAGDLNRAIATLSLSKWLCNAFKAPFEGEDLLQDYLLELAVSKGLTKALGKRGWTPPEPAHDMVTFAQSGDPSDNSGLERLRRGSSTG